MTLDQLEALIAVVEGGGLKGASTILNKTQPSISAGLKNLESELEIQLFDRKGYRIKLTEAGNKIFNHAKEVLQKRDNICTTATELKQGVEPNLKIAVDYLSPYTDIFELLCNFTHKHENTDFEFSFEVLGGAEDKVLNEGFDIALTPFISKHAKLVSKKLCELTVLPVGKKSVFQKERPDPSIFGSRPQIVVRDSSKNSPEIDFSGDFNFRWLTVSDHMIKREMILSGMGWGMLEYSSIKKELELGELIELDIQSTKRKELSLYMIRPSDKDPGPVLSEFWETLISSFN